MASKKEEIKSIIEKKDAILNEAIVEKCIQKNMSYKILDEDNVGTGKREICLEDIEILNPFHWDFIFGNIINSGGFDIILTNPPWEKLKLEDKEFLRSHGPYRH